jgi:hypothetical protein
MGFTRPTDERLKHAGSAEYIVIDDPENKVSVVTIRIVDWILDRLRHRAKPAVTADQYYAGSRFYSDWYHAHPHSSSSFDPTRIIVDNSSTPQYTETERMMVCKMRFERALRALCTKHGVVLQSCLINEETLESFGCRMYGYKDSKDARLVALTVLRDALDALAEHYHGRRRGPIDITGVRKL